MSLRDVRSPETPNITITHGAGFRSCCKPNRSGLLPARPFVTNPPSGTVDEARPVLGRWRMAESVIGDLVSGSRSPGARPDAAAVLCRQCRIGDSNLER